MAEHGEESGSVTEKTYEKPPGHDSSSSSDSDNEKSEVSSSSIKKKIYWLFGREKPVHKVLGGGKPADVFLWRNKKISAAVLGGVTAIWVLFELLNYHLLTLVPYILILSLTILLLWSKATTFINKSPPRIPEVHIPKDLAINIALALRFEINRALAVLRDIASGRDLRMFLAVIVTLWVLSILGSCFNYFDLQSQLRSKRSGDASCWSLFRDGLANQLNCCADCSVKFEIEVIWISERVVRVMLG